MAEWSVRSALELSEAAGRCRSGDFNTASCCPQLPDANMAGYVNIQVTVTTFDHITLTVVDYLPRLCAYAGSGLAVKYRMHDCKTCDPDVS